MYRYIVKKLNFSVFVNKCKDLQVTFIGYIYYKWQQYFDISIYLKKYYQLRIEVNITNKIYS